MAIEESPYNITLRSVTWTSPNAQHARASERYTVVPLRR